MARIAVVGAGPAGVIASYFASQNEMNEVVIFEAVSPLKTILPTGGGRCNLAFGEFDFRELAKFYPRGEKFLFSVFSKISTAETLEFFEKIGVETYMQEDMRIFPVSNSAKEVREKLLNSLKGCKIQKEKVTQIIKKENGFEVQSVKSKYLFDRVILALGGHAGFELARKLGHKIITPKPSLTGFITEKDYAVLSGVSVEADVIASFDGKTVFEERGNVLFTHKGVSGPMVYKISSICARENFSKENPIFIKLKFLSDDVDFQKLLEENAKKDLKNLISEFMPKSFAEYVLNQAKIKLDKKCFEINKELRERVLTQLKEFEIKAVSPFKDGEVVTSGGVCLDEINSKNMQSKLVDGVYFCGEVIDVDGFCGGFNLQNCWSTGYIAGIANS